MDFAWWIIAIVDASASRSMYLERPNPVREAWQRSGERSRWFSLAIPDPRTWLGARLRTQADGAKTVGERV
jgi:hypothetical protein